MGTPGAPILTPPEWPDMGEAEVLDLAFDRYQITDEDHPIVKENGGPYV